MGYKSPDVYYQPEKFDLRPVAEIDYSDGNYNFDIRCVWLHIPTNRLLTARDSGCSCPSPFEDHTKLTDLDEVDIDELEAEVRQKKEHTTPDERDAFLSKVRNALRPLPKQDHGPLF